MIRNLTRTRASTRSRTLRIAAAFAVAAMLGVAAGSVAQARGSVPEWSSYDDDIVKANKDKAAQQQRASDLRAALSETDKAIGEATIRLDELQTQLPAVQEEYRLAKERYDTAVLQQQIVADKLTAAEAEDKQLTEQIAKDAEELDSLSKTLAELARSQYRASDSNSTLAIVFGSKSSSEFIDEITFRQTSARVQSNTLADLEELAAVNRNRQTRQEAVRDYIAELKVQADALVEETATAKAAAEEKKAAVEEMVAEAEQLKDYLEDQRAIYLQQQQELEAAAQELQAELDQLWQKKLEEEAINGTGKLEKGFLSPPTAVPYITSGYGWRMHPVYHVNKLHAGTDFRAYCGTPIMAAADGTVEWAKYRSGYGNQIMLDHGPISGKVLFTSYNHLTSFAVNTGQSVKRGQVIGYSGTTGTSTACHLHFEVYINGATVDPMLYVADW